MTGSQSHHHSSSPNVGDSGHHPGISAGYTEDDAGPAASDQQRRRRTTNAHVALNREALAVVQPFAGKIAGWQRKAAHFEAIGLHLRSHGRPISPAVLARAASLVVEVEAAYREFSEGSKAMPPAVISSSRWQDVDKALQSVREAAFRGHEALARS